eukprot:TRINITY_DN664_c0_g2_i2.p1 TRINITY_DN664_c0_g2~~TRINITY_DN664_c0_g2_i2.p1  ORF type:complete len:548 (+),score=104.86 TRINITY_DN664_c0_g2_i2:30-1646(+)
MRSTSPSKKGGATYFSATAPSAAPFAAASAAVLVASEVSPATAGMQRVAASRHLAIRRSASPERSLVSPTRAATVSRGRARARASDPGPAPGGEVDSSIMLLVCQICNKRYSAKSQVGLHVCPKCADPTKVLGGPSKQKKPSEPPAVLCYICGQKFGTASITIHQPQCMKKRAMQQAKLPPDLRTAIVVPGRPLKQFSGGSIEEYNDQAYQAYQESLVQCPNCGRRFAPDRLQVHLRSCKPGHSSRPISQAAKIKQSGGEGAPGSPPSALKNRTSASTDSAGSRPSSSPKSKRPSTSVRFSLDVEEHCDSPSTASSDSSGQRKSALTHTQKLTAALAESRSGCGQQAAPADECGDQERVQCSYCNRKFAPDRVAQHEAVCQATQAKQRRQFDSSKMRVQGTEVEPFVKKGVGCAKGKPAAKSTWRLQHEQFQAAMHAGRGNTSAADVATELSMKTPEELHPEYVQCPYCQRRFNETAAARHIPKCKEMEHRVRPLCRSPSPASATHTGKAAAVAVTAAKGSDDNACTEGRPCEHTNPG